MLWIIGTYDFTHPSVAVIVFGFAAGFEIFVIRPAGEKTGAVAPAAKASTLISQSLPMQDSPVASLKVAGGSKNGVESNPSTDAPHDDEEEVWTVAIREFEGDQRRAGLWAKSFAMENGDEAKAKATYLRERVQQLADEAATRKMALAIQQAVATQDVLDGIARATKGLIDGTGSTPKDIAFLSRASGVDASLTSLADRNRGDTLLHLCARYGFYDEAMILLKNGANPNVGNGNGQKPFAVAALGTELREALMKATEETATT